MQLRKHAARHFWLQAWASFTHLVTHSPEAESQVIQDETRSELWKMVDLLDEKYRMVVVLRLVHGLTVGEISQVLALNEKTVYSRLYAAFGRLRAQLKTRPEFTALWDEVQP